MDNLKLIKFSDELKKELKEKIEAKIKTKRKKFMSYFDDNLAGNIFESITGKKVSDFKTIKEIDNVAIVCHQYKKYSPSIVTERGNIFTNEDIDIDKVFTDRLESMN